MHRNLVTTLGALSIGLIFVVSQPTFARKGESLKQRLAGGEIIQKSSDANEKVLQGMVTAVFDAPPEDVWAVISDCSRYSETMYGVRASKLLEHKGKHWICEMTVGVPGPFPDLNSVTDSVHTMRGKRWERKWTLVKGDYEENNGSWVVGPFDEEGTRTLVVYNATVKPNIAVPDVILRWAQTRSFKEVFRKLRAEVAKYRAAKLKK